MENEKNTAETTVDETDVGIDAGANENEVDSVNEDAFADSDDGSAKVADEPPAEDARVEQTHAQNSENARRRREAEQKRELREARVKATIEALDGKNPYTGKPMKDDADVEEYFTMREIQRKGGDPVGDYSEFQKQRERDRAEQERKDTEKREWFQKDSMAFAEKYPDVKIDELISDKLFQAFAEGKVGKQPLATIYESYLSFTSEHEKRAKNKAAQTLANSKASPGSLKSPSTNDGSHFTREQVQKMSQEEVSKNYDKIRASMAKWK